MIADPTGIGYQGLDVLPATPGTQVTQVPALSTIVRKLGLVHRDADGQASHQVAERPQTWEVAWPSRRWW
jgi:hypothetical protein